MKGTRPASIVRYVPEIDPGSHQPANEHDPAPGSYLPADFPQELRDELTPDQLVMLEEYYLSKREATIHRFFRLLRIHPHSMDLTTRHVTINCAILAKLLRLHDLETAWKDIAAQLGISLTTLKDHRAAIRQILATWQD